MRRDPGLKLRWKKMSRALISLLLIGIVQINASAQDDRVYTMDAEASRADILVRKGGKLAWFGHDHVVSTTKIEGSISLAAKFADSRAELNVLLDTLEVDREDLREHYDINKKIPGSAKKSTRENMLGKVLESIHWPEVSIVATVAVPDPRRPMLEIAFTMHGVTLNFELSVSLQVNADELRANGTFGLLQTDYGIEPYSAVIGGLVVQNSVEIHFNLVANRQHPDPGKNHEGTNH